MRSARPSLSFSFARKLITAVSLGVIFVVAVLLGISGLRQQQQQQQHDSSAADFGSRNAGVAVSVFETSMRTGTKLSQSFPSPAGFIEVRPSTGRSYRRCTAGDVDQLVVGLLSRNTLQSSPTRRRLARMPCQKSCHHDRVRLAIL